VAGASRQLHPAFALLLACVLHSGAWAALRWTRPLALPRGAPLEGDVPVELSLLVEQAQRGGQPSTPAPPSGASAAAPSSRARRPDLQREQHPSALSRPDAAGEGESGADSHAAAARGDVATPRAIDVGLSGGVRQAALLGGWLEQPAPRRPVLDGGLLQGLAARDAERGLSRSSAAQHAAFQAARRFAPAIGIGVFDITADEHGVVLSVTLASALSNEADWQRVGEELQQLLRDRRLRIPPGARGLAARLRVETGELAQDIAQRSRLPRGAALGQAPSHPRELRAESTRNSLEPGQLSPALGMGIAGGGGASVRVVLVEERAL
jgi:hypothetical protein